MSLQKQLIEEGNEQDYPQRGDIVVVEYTGWLYDKDRADHRGDQFDSSVDRGDFSTEIAVGKVIKGWDEAVPQMSLGERSVLTIPSDLAYGSRGFPGLIPTNATLILRRLTVPLVDRFVKNKHLVSYVQSKEQISEFLYEAALCSLLSKVNISNILNMGSKAYNEPYSVVHNPWFPPKAQVYSPLLSSLRKDLELYGTQPLPMCPQYANFYLNIAGHAGEMEAHVLLELCNLWRAKVTDGSLTEAEVMIYQQSLSGHLTCWLSNNPLVTGTTGLVRRLGVIAVAQAGKSCQVRQCDGRLAAKADPVWFRMIGWDWPVKALVGKISLQDTSGTVIQLTLSMDDLKPEKLECLQFYDGIQLHYYHIIES